MVDSIEEIRPERIQSEHLESLLDGIERRQDELFETVRTASDELQPDVLRGDVIALERHQDEIREQHQEYFELENKHRRLYDARQRQIIREGITGLIGERWSNILSTTVLALIFVVLTLLTYEMFFLDTETHPNLVWVIFWIDFSACVIFLFEFCLRWYYARDNRWFWRKNWIDFVSSIPIPPVTGVHYHRWGRLIRVVRVLRLWRAVRIGMFLWRGLERLQRVTNVKLMKRSIILTALFVLAGALAAFYTEQGAQGLPYSVWWSFNTVATGDYADLHAPDGPALRIVTALLILCGMVVVSVLVATVTSIYQGQEWEPARKAQREMHQCLQIGRAHV